MPDDLLPASGAAQPHPLERQDAHSYQLALMRLRRPEYLRSEAISVRVGCWNVGDFSCHQDVKNWFAGDEGPDVYALGLQEVVDLNQTSNFLKYIDPAIALRWKAHVQAVLPAEYICVASPQLLGLLLLVYVAPEKKRKLAVTSVSTSSVGTGLMGYIGNKGAVGVRIVLGDTLRLSFVNCHLAAFANAVDRRNWDVSEIAKRMRFEPVAKGVVGLAGDPESTATATTSTLDREALDTTDVVLWFGDLNYRIDLDNGDVRSLLQPYMPRDPPPSHDGGSSPVLASSPIELPSTPPSHSPTTLQGTLESLLKHDQLLKQRREGKAFTGYREGKITFLPTYKYDVCTVGVWDSEKARVPSWCDRILWRLKEPASPEKDHKPNPESAADVGDSPADPLPSALDKEVLFETFDDSDSDQEDLVVSRAESPLPLARAAPTFPRFDDPTSTISTPFGEVRFEQTSYTSHQNISSSDHKPVSATFHLTYPAVDPEKRSEVHADVAREVDKLENERRPVVTVIIDQSEPGDSTSGGEDGAIDFGHVRFWESKRRNVTVANTGTSKAKVRFVGRPSSDGGSGGAEVFCKPWIAVELQTEATQTAELQPGEVVNISVALRVCTVQHVLALNGKHDTLDDVLVLRVEDGRDVFIPVSAKWQYCSYGTTLKELIGIPEGVGGFRGYREAEEKQVAKKGPLYSAPREIYRITQFLCDALAEITATLGPDESIEDKRWFSQLGWPFLKETWINLADGGGGDQDGGERRRMIEVGVWEALDTDRDFDDPACLSEAMDADQKEVGKEELAEAVAGVFLCWLEGLSDGVVPETLWDEVVKAGGDVKASERVLDHLPEEAGQVHANVFIYLVGFISEVVTILAKKREGDNKKEMDKLLAVILEPVARALVRKPQNRAAVGAKVAAREDEARRAWVRRFVEM